MIAKREEVIMDTLKHKPANNRPTQTIRRSQVERTMQPTRRDVHDIYYLKTIEIQYGYFYSRLEICPRNSPYLFFRYYGKFLFP